MGNIIRSPEAKRDAVDIWTYIARDNLAAADRLLEGLDERLRLLADTPLLGRPREELAPNLRSYPVGNFILFYQPTPSGIELVRILHGARNLRRLFHRLRRLDQS